MASLQQTSGAKGEQDSPELISIGVSRPLNLGGQLEHSPNVVASSHMIQRASKSQNQRQKRYQTKQQREAEDPALKVVKAKNQINLNIDNNFIKVDDSQGANLIYKSMGGVLESKSSLTMMAGVDQFTYKNSQSFHQENSIEVEKKLLSEKDNNRHEMLEFQNFPLDHSVSMDQQQI